MHGARRALMYIKRRAYKSSMCPHFRLSGPARVNAPYEGTLGYYLPYEQQRMAPYHVLARLPACILPQECHAGLKLPGYKLQVGHTTIARGSCAHNTARRPSPCSVCAQALVHFSKGCRPQIGPPRAQSKPVRSQCVSYGAHLRPKAAGRRNFPFLLSSHNPPSRGSRNKHLVNAEALAGTPSCTYFPPNVHVSSTLRPQNRLPVTGTAQPLVYRSRTARP